MKNIQNELGILVNIILQNVYTNYIEVGAADRLIKQIMDIRENIMKENMVTKHGSSDILGIDGYPVKIGGDTAIQYNNG